MKIEKTGWILFFITIVMCLLVVIIFQSCEQGRKIATLTKVVAEVAELKSKNESLTSSLAQVKQELTGVRTEKAALIEDKKEQKEAIDAIQKQSEKYRLGRIWWCNRWKKADAALKQAKQANATLVASKLSLEERIQSLEAEKNEINDGYTTLLGKKKELETLLDEEKVDQSNAQIKWDTLKSELKGKLDEASSKREELETEVNDKEVAIVALKKQVDTKIIIEKDQRVANTFRTLILTTAISPERHLNEKIRNLATEILIWMQGRDNDKLFAFAGPIMERMPNQKNSDVVPGLHDKWAKWKDLRVKQKE